MPKVELSHSWLNKSRWSGRSFLFLCIKSIIINTIFKKINTKQRVIITPSKMCCFYAVLPKQCRCTPVVPLWILWCSFSMLCDMASSTHSAYTFAFPRQRNLWNPRSHFRLAKLPSADSARCLSNFLDISRLLRLSLSGFFQWVPLIHLSWTGHPAQFAHW